MSRTKSGPRLWREPEEYDKDGKLSRHASWVIRDGGKKIRTGLRASSGKQPSEEAIEALGRYIVESRGAPRERNRYASEVLIADVIAIYLTDKASKQARPQEVAGRAKRLLEWWGEKTLNDVTGVTCRQYVDYRGTDGAARRELEDLRAAIKHHREQGLCREVVEVVLPDRGEARDRWLTRAEAARLIWRAWRYREVQKGVETDRKSRQHVARFTLIGLYSGTRSGAICSAALEPMPGHGWINLETGVFYRRAAGQRQTKKRKPPVRLSNRLLSHLRRWHKNGQTYAVEFNGKPISGVDKAFRSCVADAKLGEGVSPHTLRHTAATWLMQNGVELASAASLLGMTVETLERVYWHHHPDYQVEAAEALARSPGQNRDRKGGIKAEQTRTDENKVVEFARVS